MLRSAPLLDDVAYNSTLASREPPGHRLHEPQPQLSNRISRAHRLRLSVGGTASDRYTRTHTVQVAHRCGGARYSSLRTSMSRSIRDRPELKARVTCRSRHYVLQTIEYFHTCKYFHMTRATGTCRCGRGSPPTASSRGRGRARRADVGMRGRCARRLRAHLGGGASSCAGDSNLAPSRAHVDGQHQVGDDAGEEAGDAQPLSACARRPAPNRQCLARPPTYTQRGVAAKERDGRAAHRVCAP